MRNTIQTLINMNLENLKERNVNGEKQIAVNRFYGFLRGMKGYITVYDTVLSSAREQGVIISHYPEGKKENFYLESAYNAILIQFYSEYYDIKTSDFATDMLQSIYMNYAGGYPYMRKDILEALTHVFPGIKFIWHGEIIEECKYCNKFNDNELDFLENLPKYQERNEILPIMDAAHMQLYIANNSLLTVVYSNVHQDYILQDRSLITCCPKCGKRFE